MSGMRKSLTLIDRFERAIKRHRARGDYTRIGELSEDVRRQFGIHTSTPSQQDEPNPSKAVQ